MWYLHVEVIRYFHLVWRLLVTEEKPNAYFTHPRSSNGTELLADVIFTVTLQLTSNPHEYELVLKLMTCASFHFVRLIQSK